MTRDPILAQVSGIELIELSSIKRGAKRDGKLAIGVELEAAPPEEGEDPPVWHIGSTVRILHGEMELFESKVKYSVTLKPDFDGKGREDADLAEELLDELWPVFSQRHEDAVARMSFPRIDLPLRIPNQQLSKKVASD